MMATVLLLSLILPVLLALLVGSRLQRLALLFAPWAALPALVLGTFPGFTVELPWLLLGTRLGVDDTGAPFLLLAGVLWTAAGVYARGYLSEDTNQARFAFFYLLTLTGNLGVIVALDTASFYLFFAIMTFAAYGLVVHDGSAAARRAGRVYLILGLLGEMLLLAATLLIVTGFGNADLRDLGMMLGDAESRNLIIGLTLAGFAIKMGAVPLHVWLPLAHPYAPTPASAVLSGIIIKAGLIGWLRFLPLGDLPLPGWGLLTLVFGLVSTFYGVLAGLPQVRPKTVLAYSSISQMGLITALLGIGLSAAEQWPMIFTVLLLFALHHGLAKGALFLGTGITANGGRWTGWGLVLPALALAGAPLTSGYLAKTLLKDVAHMAPGGLANALPALIWLSSGATTVLMARFLYLSWPRRRTGSTSPWLGLPWLGLLAAIAILPWWWARIRLPGIWQEVLAPSTLVASLWPLLVGAVLAVAVAAVGRRRGLTWRLPEGDIIVPLERLVGMLARVKPWRRAETIRLTLPFSPWEIDPLLRESERRLQLWGVAGAGLLVLAVGLYVLLWDG